MRGRRGQVAVYLVLVLVAIAVLMLMNVGAFLAVRAKNRAMNAGDAAALAAARVQGEILNEIGRLNLEHAVADESGQYGKSLEIIREQKRLAFLGPFRALRAAQEAARANGAPRNAEMESILRQHVSHVRSAYAQTPELFPEPWEGAWEEYASELSAAVSEGICAGPDNIDFADAVQCFPLYSRSFYEMIFGEAWCKLVVANWTFLLNCDSHNMPHPVYNENDAVVNCEICSLQLRLQPLALADEDERTRFRDALTRNGATFPPRDELVEDRRPADDPSRYYFVYDPVIWRDWREMDPDSEFHFPLLGKVKPVFNVLGCASVFRVIETIPRLLTETTTTGSWSAAAKPFGTIRAESGEAIVTDESAFGLVLPAYEETRLIPLSAAYVDGQDLATADKDWLDHIREHIPQYLADGVDALPVCRFCGALTKWEDASYRAKIADWVKAHGQTCVRSSGSVVYEGGTSYAH